MKGKIKEIIKNNQQRNLKTTFQRIVDVPFSSGKIISIIGPRRAGKTHLLYLLMQKAMQHGADKSQIILMNFEDERLVSPDFEFDLILQAYRELYPTINLDTCYFFFDEIQNIPHWEKFVRRLYDDHSKNIYVTGSNSSYLSTEIASSLRGRSLTVEVLPLSFQEFLLFRGSEVDMYSSAGKAHLSNAFRDYLTYGGFPELVHMEESLKLKVLQEYFNVMIFRDLIDRFEISQPLLLKYFFKKVFVSVGKTLSINKIYNEFKSNKYAIGKNTLYDFQNYGQDAYVMKTLSKFSHSESKRENSDKKAYAVDWGLLAAVEYSSSDDWGKLFENLVVLEFMKCRKNIYFYKQVVECDLVVEDTAGQYLPVQISYEMVRHDTLKRELKGLKEAAKYLGVNKGLIITMDQEEEIPGDFNVKIIPAYKYFTMSEAQLDFLF